MNFKRKSYYWVCCNCLVLEIAYTRNQAVKKLFKVMRDPNYINRHDDLYISHCKIKKGKRYTRKYFLEK